MLKDVSAPQLVLCRHWPVSSMVACCAVTIPHSPTPAAAPQGVQAKMPSGISDAGLTISGFIYLHSLFITRGRLESTWAVMRRFGYDDELRLAADFVDRVGCRCATGLAACGWACADAHGQLPAGHCLTCTPSPAPAQVSLQCAPDQALELSEAAVSFLSRQFELHDSSGSGVLAITDMDRMFSTSPAPIYQVRGAVRADDVSLSAM